MSSFDIFSYYSPPRMTLSTHIHPDSVAAQLGLTPEELTPILQDQQREYQQHELEYEAAQPPFHFTHTIHPDSVAAQLGLTPEELIPILQDQHCEYQQEELEYEAAQPPLYSTHTIHPDSTAAQLGMEDMEEVLEDQREGMRQEEEEE